MPLSPSSARTPRLRAVVTLAGLALAGCTGLQARKTPVLVAVRDRLERADTFSGPAAALLRRENLLDRDPAGAARALECAVQQCPTPDGLLALAELSYHAAQRADRFDPDAARPWYRDAAAYAAFALADADEAVAGPAANLHNRAVEHLIRLAHARRVRHGRSWAETFADLDVALDSTEPFLAPARLDDIQIARDYRVRGAQAEYGSGGLGVPLVATRPNDREQPAEPQDRFFPERLRAAATAVLHPDGSPAAGDWRRRPVTLVLHDPFAEREVLVGGRAVPLASDRTTPLAVQVAGSSLAALVRVGVRRPDINRADYGLYVVQPYRPGKIPVVLVHGFRSSVATWVQTLNHLQSDPVLSERYQFWLYLYPTGATLPALAAGLRTALREALDTFDPWGADPALGQMVLIGHSMGGILSKMLVQDSGTELWDAVFRVPYDELRAPPDVKERLAVRLFYRPEPYVRRVVFVATGHGGSRLASLFLGRLVQALIREPATLRRTVFPILWQNGLRVVAPGIRLRRLNGVGEMRPRDPVLRAIDRAGIDPSVPYHSVIPQLGLDGIDLPTDGVVPYWSSHLDGAESETITRGFHTSQDSPEVTAELKQILREHLAAIEGAK